MEVQPDREWIKGPPKNIAFDAEGYKAGPVLRAQGFSEELFVKSVQV